MLKRDEQLVRNIGCSKFVSEMPRAKYAEGLVALMMEAASTARELLPDYTALQPRTQPFSFSPPPVSNPTWKGLIVKEAHFYCTV
jgi:hypothetical protein